MVLGTPPKIQSSVIEELQGDKGSFQRKYSSDSLMRKYKMEVVKEQGKTRAVPVLRFVANNYYNTVFIITQCFRPGKVII